MKKKIAIVAALATVFAAGITATSTTIEASARRVDYVGYVEKEDAPVIDGHTFIGWYLDEGCTVEFTKQTLSSDLTIYAKYRNNSKTYHTVTVTSLVGNYTPVTLLFEEGSKLPEIGNVFNAEKFTPSFVDESGAPVTTETVVNDDMTIYAEWTENSFTLYYRLNDAEPMLNSAYSFDKYDTGWDKAKTLYKDEMAGSILCTIT